MDTKQNMPIFPTLLPSDDPQFYRTRFARLFVPSWIAYFCYSMGRRPFTAARSLIQESTGLSKSSIAVADSFFLTTYALGQLFYGPIKSKIGLSSRTLLVLGLCASSISVAMTVVYPTVAGFSFALSCNGFAQAVGWASCMVILTPWLRSEERGSKMGLWGTNMAAGGVFGNFLAGILMSAFDPPSWQAVVLGTSALMCFVGICLHFALVGHPNTVGLMSTQQTKENTDANNAVSVNKTVDGEILYNTAPAIVTEETKEKAAADEKAGVTTKDLIRVPGLLALSLSYFLNKLVRYVLIFWLPYYLTQHLKYSGSQAANIASFLDLGGIIGTVGSGICADKYKGGKRRVTVTVYFIVGMAVSCFALILDAASPPLLMAVCFATGFFGFGIDSLQTGPLVQDLADRQDMQQHLGSISGFLGGVGTAGSILASALVVFSANWAALWTTLTVLSGIAGVLLLGQIREQK